MLPMILVLAVVLVAPALDERRAGDLVVERKTLTAEGGTAIEADFGRLFVPEDRGAASRRLIEIAFVRLKCTREAPSRAPLFFLEGGPGSPATPGASRPEALAAWLPILALSDVVLVDQRGTGQSRPNLAFASEGGPPVDVFRDEATAKRRVLDECRKAAARFRADGVDLSAYTTEASADDIDDLRAALGAEKMSLLGFSYGTHLGLSVIRRHGDRVENAVLVGVEGPDQTRKLPSDVDTQFRRISRLAARDPRIAAHVPDFMALLERVLARLERQPIDVTVKDPSSGAELTVPVGTFGLRLILLFDYGDSSDIPVFPRLLHSIDRGDPSVLAWFVRKRLFQMGGLSAMTFAVDAASGASPERWARIARETPLYPMGNVANFPFPEVGAAVGARDLGEGFRGPLVSDVRTLFVSGTLDGNCPTYQAEGLRWAFTDAVHLSVENAGHEAAFFDPRVHEIMRRFLAGEDVRGERVVQPPLRFVPVEGYDPLATHPSVPRPGGGG